MTRTSSELKNEYNSLVSESRERVRNPTNSDWIPETDDRIRRKRHTRFSVEKEFLRFGEVVGRGLNLWWKLLPRKHKRECHNTLYQLHIFQLSCFADYFYILSSLTKLAKNGQDRLFPGYWRYLVDIALISDYKPVTSEPFPADWMISDVMEWVAPKTQRKEYLDIYPSSVTYVLNHWPGECDCEEVYTFREFLARRDLWAVAGSARGAERIYAEEGTIKSKWSTALSKTADELYEFVKTDRTSHNVFVKREAKKERLVVNAPLPLYLKMAYVGFYLHQLYTGCDWCASWQTADQREAWMRRMVREANGISYSQDQSKFDHHVSKEEIFFALEGIKGLRSRFPPAVRDEVCSMITDIGRTLESARIEIGDRTLLWQGGIMSGWFFTSMLDSICNLCQYFTILRVLHVPDGDPLYYPNCLCVLGDDFTMRIDSVGTGVALLEQYAIEGYDVKPQDTWVGGSAEFLRKTLGKDASEGYYARSLLSCLYRNPVTENPPSGLIRAMEVATRWYTVWSRGGDLPGVENELLIELCAGLAISRDTASRLLHTPRSLGGLGWAPLIDSDLIAISDAQEEREISFPIAKDISTRFMTKRDKRKWLGQYMPRQSSQYKIQPGHILRISSNRWREVPRRWLNFGRSVWPTSPEWDDNVEVGLILQRSFLVEKWIREEDYSAIRALLTVHGGIWFDYYYKHWSHNIFNEWLLHGLNGPGCFYDRVSSECISRVSNQAFNAAWAVYYTGGQFRYNDYVAIRLGIERSMGTLLSSYLNGVVWRE